MSHGGGYRGQKDAPRCVLANNLMRYDICANNFCAVLHIIENHIHAPRTQGNGNSGPGRQYFPTSLDSDSTLPIWKRYVLRGNLEANILLWNMRWFRSVLLFLAGGWVALDAGFSAQKWFMVMTNCLAASEICDDGVWQCHRVAKKKLTGINGNLNEIYTHILILFKGLCYKNL